MRVNVRHGDWTADLRFQQLNPGVCRTYLAGKQGIKEVALVDPVLERLDDYLLFLRTGNLKLSAVIDTHTHADHVSAGSALRDLAGCDYIMYRSAPAGCVTKRVSDGQLLRFAGIEARVIFTPGHSSDSMCLVLPGRVLTGDTLFLDDGGAGRDDLPGGDPGAHWESLRKLMELPDELVAFPAHEYRGRGPSRLREQKLSNPLLKIPSKEEYIAYIHELKLGPADWMKKVLDANYACARDPSKTWVPVDLHACEVRGTLEKGVNDQVAVPITTGELKAELDRGESPLLLDVRERSELIGELGHLPGIMHISIDELGRRLAELEPFHDKEIVAICRRGGRSHTAAQMLQQSGFHHVHFLEGGMTAWKEKGYPAEK